MPRPVLRRCGLLIFCASVVYLWLFFAILGTQKRQQNGAAQSLEEATVAASTTSYFVVKATSNQSDAISCTVNNEIDKEKMENRRITELVDKRAPIFCVILTKAEHHQTQCRAVLDTWGRHCERIIFLSGASDPLLPAFAVDGIDVSFSCDALRVTLEPILRANPSLSSWILVTGDDSYFVMENLRKSLLLVEHEDSHFTTISDWSSTVPWYDLQNFTFGAVTWSVPKSNHRKTRISVRGARKKLLNCFTDFGIISSLTLHNASRAFNQREAFRTVWRATVDGAIPLSEIPEIVHAVAFHRVNFDHMYSLEYLVNRAHVYGAQALNKAVDRANDDERTIADLLAENVTVLCLILTKPENHADRCTAIRDTWAKRCSKFFFISDENDPSLPAVYLHHMGIGYEMLWGKVRQAFRFAYQSFGDDFDWFLKADDDTFVVVENLRYMLLSRNAREPHYFGFKFRPLARRGYNSGGAGYVLSKEALRRLVTEAYETEFGDICKVHSSIGMEDVEVARCLQSVGVHAGDSRDRFGRERFHVFEPHRHTSPFVSLPLWFRENQYYPMKQGIGCCSDLPVSFHYISAPEMYTLDYLVYRLKRQGVLRSRRSFNIPQLATARDALDMAFMESTDDLCT